MAEEEHCSVESKACRHELQTTVPEEVFIFRLEELLFCPQLAGQLFWVHGLKTAVLGGYRAKHMVNKNSPFVTEIVPRLNYTRSL